MKITQIIATADGGSRFEDIDIPFDNEREGAGGYTFMSSVNFRSEGVCFVCMPADMDQDWHQAPTRQFVQVISGSVKVTTTDDAVRRWRAGDMFIAADIAGRGHKTRVVDGPATVMFVPLPDGALV